jgi:hypothetical protein
MHQIDAFKLSLPNKSCAQANTIFGLICIGRSISQLISLGKEAKKRKKKNQLLSFPTCDVNLSPTTSVNLGLT